MKFDCVVMNPPYQANTDNKGSGHTLWDKFVDMAISKMVKQDGYLCSVNPSGWRGITSQSYLFDKMKSNNLMYLEIHNIKDGQKIFNAATRYDWYVLKHCKKYDQTTILGEDGEEYSMDIRDKEFIPNFNMSNIVNIDNIFANNDSERINVINDRSAYGADKKHLSKEKTEEFKYPCVKYISQKDYSISFRWSNTNQNGHFGIPKVMFGIGAGTGGIYVDYKGEYGMCQFMAGIVGDTKEELENIKKALESKKFKDIMSACQFGTEKYNIKIIRLFRKDFWKEFV